MEEGDGPVQPQAMVRQGDGGTNTLNASFPPRLRLMASPVQSPLPTEADTAGEQLSQDLSQQELRGDAGLGGVLFTDRNEM